MQAKNGQDHLLHQYAGMSSLPRQPGASTHGHREAHETPNSISAPVGQQPNAAKDEDGNHPLHGIRVGQHGGQDGV